jgi:hypothetical protein
MRDYRKFICRHVRFPYIGLICLTLAALPALRADVTLRYKSEVEMNPNLPAQILQSMMKAMDASLPKSQTMQLKQGRLVSETGTVKSITDFSKHEITFMDTAGKRYATMPSDRYADEVAKAMPQMPEEAKNAMGAMKSHVEAKATGKTATIQGVEGEERQIDITMDGPAMPNIPAGPMMHMVMHLWTAKASEAARVPAVGEMARYDILSVGGADPVSSMAKAFNQLPGFADTFTGIFKELRSGGSPVVLRMQIEMYMPLMAALSMAAGNAAGAKDAPMVRLNYDLDEISAAPLPDSLFQIPEGYQSVPAADIIKDLVKEKTAAMTGK